MNSVLIGKGLLSSPEVWRSLVNHRSVCIISDPLIAYHYLPALSSALEQAGARNIISKLIPVGEKHKTLKTAQKIWDFLIDEACDRHTLLIALGGGVVGDLVGFCGACYMRGISVVQCPTSLLAQIDAAIGGKTGVNHNRGKNLIGAFHMPEKVMIDLQTLQTLPERELRSAIAELIKYGLIADHVFFTWIETNLPLLLAKDETALEYAVSRAVSLKSNIVSQDEKDRGVRAILNFGHTLGHAIESLQNYKKWTHGEAVGVGMLAALHISIQRNGIDKTLLDRLITLLNAAKLPIKLPKGITDAVILAKIKQDKKQNQGNLSWVLLKALGSACPGNVVLPEELHQALTFVQA